jgi:MFS family permease
MISNPIKRDNTIDKEKTSVNKSINQKTENSGNTKQDNFSKFLKDSKLDKSRTTALRNPTINQSNSKSNLQVRNVRLNVSDVKKNVEEYSQFSNKEKTTNQKQATNTDTEDIKEVNELYDKPLKIKNSLNCSIKSTSAFSAMEGLGSFIGAFAVALNASSTMLGLISSLPEVIGSFFQLASIKVAETFKNRKVIMAFVAFIQAILWIPLLLIPVLFKTNSALVLLLVVSLIASCSLFLNPISASLMGDLVPCEERGRYFGKRTKFGNISNFTAAFIGGLVLNYLAQNHKILAFSFLFGFAFIFRMISVFYLSRLYEPGFIPSKKENEFTLFNFIGRIRKSNYGRYVLFLFFFRFAVNIVAPFFTLYMLKDLGFNYIQFTLVALAPILASFLTMSYWGKQCDSIGSKNVLLISGFLLPLIPILWVLSANFYYLVILEFLGGIAWAAFNLSSSSFVYDATSPQKRMRCVSYMNLFNNFGIFFGAALGGLLLRHGDLSFFTHNVLIQNNILILAIISGVLRLVVALVFLPTLREDRLVELFGSKEPFDKRMVTMHPHPTNHTYEHIDRRCNVPGHEHGVVKEQKKEKPVLNTMINTLKFTKEANVVISKKPEKKRITNTPYEPGSFRRK